MKKRKSLNVLLALLFIFLGANKMYAVSANDELTVYRQPSGITFKAAIKGDEHFNYVTTENGEVISKGEDNYWYYEQNSKKRNNDSYSLSNAKVGIDATPKNSVTEEILAEIETPYNELEIDTKETTSTTKNRSLNKTENLLVILVDFNDIQTKYSEKEWSNIIFGDTAPSLKNYYSTMTNNSLSIEPAREAHDSQNDGIIKVKLNRTHPNTGSKIFSDNQAITADALKAANFFIDYSQYDTNKNGRIEANELHFMIIVAGQEKSYNDVTEPSVWGHRWALNSDRVTLDNTVLDYYTQFGEKHGDHQATVGIIAHEFGHDLGLPDLYNTGWTDTSGITVKDGSGLGYTSLMASGSWGAKVGEYSGSTPVGLDAYSKEILGLPVEVINDYVSNKIVQSIDSGSSTILKVLTESPQYYFLIENRQFSGYDEGMLKTNNRLQAIHSGGIAVYKIDKNYTENKTNGRQIVTILDASGEETYYHNQVFGADPFFYVGKGMYQSEQTTKISKNSIPDNNIQTGDYRYDDKPTFNLTITSKPTTKMHINLSPFKGKLAVGTFYNSNTLHGEPIDFSETTPDNRNQFKSFNLDVHTTNLSGLEYATNLEYIKIGGYNIGEIEDYTALSELTKLKTMSITSMPTSSEDTELIAKLTQPVNINFINRMKDLESFHFSPRPVNDLTPLNNLPKLKNASLYSGEPMTITLQPTKVYQNELKIKLQDLVKYSDQFNNAHILIHTADPGLNWFRDSIEFNLTEDNTFTVSNLNSDMSAIFLSVSASVYTDNSEFYHSVMFKIPLIWS
ncbi:M6 family metalloprotease domain-containing protein [Vagococcus sp. JNUCC 83]